MARHSANYTARRVWECMLFENTLLSGVYGRRRGILRRCPVCRLRGRGVALGYIITVKKECGFARKPLVQVQPICRPVVFKELGVILCIHMYQKARIYKLVDNTNDNFYIGSTCSALSRRLTYHKSDAKRYEDGWRTEKCSSYTIIKNNDYQMILIQHYPCNTKEELVAKEYEIIQANPNCINKIRGHYQHYHYSKKDGRRTKHNMSQQSRERSLAWEMMRSRWKRSFGGAGWYATNLWHIDTTLFD